MFQILSSRRNTLAEIRGDRNLALPFLSADPSQYQELHAQLHAFMQNHQAAEGAQAHALAVSFPRTATFRVVPCAPAIALIDRDRALS